jgi:uncharacterized membrane protein YkoI
VFDRRSLILGLGAPLLAPALATAAPKGNEGKSQRDKKSNKDKDKDKKPKKSKPDGNGNGGQGGSGNGNASSGGANGGGAPPPADQALQAVRSGKALPLREIQAMIALQYPGVLLEADLRNGGAGLFYDLTMLSPQGRVFVVTVNAATGVVAGR